MFPWVFFGSALALSFTIGGICCLFLNKGWTGRWWPKHVPEEEKLPRATAKERS